MKFELRRYVWVIDLIGMLVGAALVGHLVANQIASALWPHEGLAEYAPSLSEPGRPVAAGRAVAGISFGRRAPCSPPVAPRRISSHHYEISRAFVDELIDHLGRLPHRTLIVPEMAGDRPVGVRVFGDLDGLTSAIGLASGDLVLEANGFPLTHPDAMLNVYATLRQTNEPWLVVERGGRRILFTYAIVVSPRAQSRWSPWQAAANSSCAP